MSLCILASLTVLGGIDGRAAPAQERRRGPKVITFQDAQGPDAVRTRRFSPAPEKPSQRAIPSLDLTPPQFKTASVPAVESESALSDVPQPGYQAGEPVSGFTLNRPPLTSSPAKRSKLGEQASATDPKWPPGASDRPRSGRLGAPIHRDQAPGLLPLTPLRESPVAEPSTDEIAGNRPAVSDSSEVLPVAFAPSELSAPLPSEQIPRSAVEATALPPLVARNTAADATSWRVVSVWVAISFSIALSLLACSLVLLTVRQQFGGKHGSILRVELTQPGGGSLVLPFSLTSQAPGANGRESSSRCRTSVADLGDSSLAAAMLGPIFGEPPGGGQEPQGEQEDAILKQILEDNIALQRGE